MYTAKITFSTRPSLVDVYNNTKKGDAKIVLSSEFNKFLSQATNFETEFALFIPTNQIYNIIERIKNIILDWSIDLENNGILGENLEFSSSERECAQKKPYYI